MKICILSPENCPSWGGVGSYVYNLVKNLPKNLDKHIITINRDVPDSFNNLLKDEDCHIHNILNVNNNDSFFYNFEFQLAVLKKLRGLHNKFNFDIIHSHSGHLPHFFSQFQKIAPLVVTVHSTVKGMNLSIKQYKSKRSTTEIFMNLLSKYIEFGEKIGFKKSDKLLPVSNYTLDQIINLYNVDITNKSVVIPNATDIEMFKPHKTNGLEENVATFIGRFYAIKGFEIYIKALISINKKGYKLNPYLIGRGNKKYINKILKNNFSKYTLQDLKPYDLMPEVYNNSDMVIVPSLSENCPSVILEAMSSGKIVIASNVGGIPEIIQNGENGLLFENGNIIDLEKKILSILEETVDIKKIQNNARKTIEDNFQWNKKALEINQIYEKCIA